MKIGLYVPMFRDVSVALQVATYAEDAGIDGVFVFDHLWPPDNPDTRSHSAMPLLSAIAASTRRIHVGSLVVRVGVVDNELLVRQFGTLRDVAGDRLIAGLGLGDAMSFAEYEALGVGHSTREQRLATLDDACAGVRDAGIQTWISGRSTAMQDLARRQNSALNLWGAGAKEVEDFHAVDLRVTWAGRVSPDSTEVDVTARALATAGASWSVFLVTGIGDDPKGAVDLVAPLVQQSSKRNL